MSERIDGGGEGDDGEWRFSLADLEEDAEDGPAVEARPVEPGSPSAENVAFFLLGALGAVGVFALLLVG
ncbi:hypothetical protein EFA46_006280 [Halarchaeum sp. CBA1220]|uniref:DUF7312 domain-containing protein n=1 Tax=Halarchaeum sp. CBA1220 TaxID=1853682 RepID=UPI000F3A98DE|nr:hypothetical protein [Halarchaeum sp. CBA1220]QLC33821.1 hypothetical protein EFA46_006280 [Halarchaeum sp. CBA1220]